MSLDILKVNEVNTIKIMLVCSDQHECGEIKKTITALNLDGAEIYSAYTIREADYLATAIRPELVICDLPEGVGFLSSLDKKGLDCAKIMISDAPDFDGIKDAINSAGICRLLKKPWSQQDMGWAIEGGIEYLDVSRAHSGLVAKAKARADYLEKLKTMLETKEKERSTSVNIYSGMVRTKKDECELMNKVLSSVPSLNSIQEIEKLLCGAIGSFTGISDVKIILSDSGMSAGSGSGGISLPLFCSGCLFGHIVFSKVGSDAFLFSQDQITLLDKISDVVAIAVERILRSSVLERLKKQWDAVFSSISDPLIIIGSDFNILRANRAFEDLVSQKLDTMTGKKCYEVFGGQGKTVPCEGCKAKDTFTNLTPSGSEVSFNRSGKNYNAWTYPIVENGTANTAVQFYKDVSEQVIYREKLLYSEKMAELGILAGSVAHEINNPVGGALALLQIMMRDEQKDSALYLDLLEMEKAAKRCKQIVDNLLHFSRSSRDEDNKDIEVSSILSTMLPLVELQIRHENIELKFKDESDGVTVRGVFNELVQVFLNVVNTSIELISKNGAKGKIEVHISHDENYVYMSVKDDGIELDLNALAGGEFKSLALFVARRIVYSHGGTVALARVDGFNTYKITFPCKANNEL